MHSKRKNKRRHRHIERQEASFTASIATPKKSLIKSKWHKCPSTNSSDKTNKQPVATIPKKRRNRLRKEMMRSPILRG